MVGALGAFLVVHVRWDTYVTRSWPRLHASGANSMQTSVKYPETQMSVLACIVSYKRAANKKKICILRRVVQIMSRGKGM